MAVRGPLSAMDNEPAVEEQGTTPRYEAVLVPLKLKKETKSVNWLKEQENLANPTFSKFINIYHIQNLAEMNQN